MTIACLLANTVTTASLINGLVPPSDLTPINPWRVSALATEFGYHSWVQGVRGAG